MIQSLLIALCLITPFTTPWPGRAAAPNLTVTATVHGLQLTLSMPNRSYPRYALVQVQGTVKNVSGHTLWFRGVGNTFPGLSNPEPEVLNRAGKVVYPPAFKYLYPLPGPSPVPYPINPGQSGGQNYYVILRDARIRLTIQYTSTNPRQVIGPFRTVHTQALYLRLTPARRPAITVQFPPGHASAVVQRPVGARGPLIRVNYSDCPDTTDNWTFIGWKPGGTSFKPDCESPREWHVIAGWVGYSVVRVDYSAPPPPTPTPAPPTATPTPQPTATGPDAAREILRRARLALAFMRTAHAVGTHVAHDGSTRTSLQIASDCESTGMPLSVRVRTHRWGTYSDALGKRRVDESYILIGLAKNGGREWSRSYPAASWKTQARDFNNLYEATSFGLDRTYAAQVCPGVIRQTYLSPAGRLSNLRVSGQETLRGRPVWVVHGRIGPAVDLYIDVGSFRLQRLVLSDGGSYSGWRVQFDYSRFNEPVHITAPAGH
jgi:hypothetical protein